MDERLLPCPFCGSDHASIRKPGVQQATVYTVGCSICHSFGPMAITEQIAVFAWNTRPDPSALNISGKQAE